MSICIVVTFSIYCFSFDTSRSSKSFEPNQIKTTTKCSHSKCFCCSSSWSKLCDRVIRYERFNSLTIILFDFFFYSKLNVRRVFLETFFSEFLIGLWLKQTYLGRQSGSVQKDWRNLRTVFWSSQFLGLKIIAAAVSTMTQFKQQQPQKLVSWNYLRILQKIHQKLFFSISNHNKVL